MNRDEHHTPQAVARMRTAHQDIGALMREDARALQLMGAATAITFAERLGVSNATAKYRLKRLWKAGLAERWRERDARSHKYTATMNAGVPTERAYEPKEQL